MTRKIAEELALFGQSIWLDNINRSLIETGKLKEMINKGLRGMTSNPTIFDKAISKSSEYDGKTRELCRQNKSTFQIYDDLTIRDIQEAADIFKPVYESTRGMDGYVSLEINPQLALKTKETIEEGKRLHKKVDRPNVMFKVPSTDAGFEAIEELLASGINVNITLIFSLEQYKKTAQAFLRGLKRLSEASEDLSRIGSVASVFVSRIDTVVDRELDELIKKTSNGSRKSALGALKGKAAVANSKRIFQEYLKIFSGKEFQALKEKGAKLQRVLWGSTSTKNPAYSDIKYVSELIGKDTINTLPDNTFEAFLDHGTIHEALTSDDQTAQSVIDNLKDFGIDIDAVCNKLLDDGVAAFEKSFLSLLDSIEQKAKMLRE
ncbi:MAG: transaldolase [bacterium]